MFLFQFLLVLLALDVCTAVPFKRVVNGNDEDTYDNRPWTAWLRKGTMRVHCGATLVADSWVVTAASCINDQINAVVVGDNDVTYPEGTEQEMEVKDTILHPDFNASTLENDIALIHLKTAVNLNNYVDVLPIMSSDNNVNEDDILSKHCRVAGWGRPECLKLNQFANPMKEIVVDRLDDIDCDAEVENRPASALCFYPYRRPELASTCGGDVGGPYICKIRRVWYLAAVISQWNTVEECTKGIKGATKISAYAPWIHDHIGPSPTPILIPPEPDFHTATTPAPPTPPPTVAPPKVVATHATTTKAPESVDATTAKTATTAEAATTVKAATAAPANADPTTANPATTAKAATTTNAATAAPANADPTTTNPATTAKAATTTNAATAAPANADPTTANPATTAKAATTTNAATAAPVNADPTTANPATTAKAAATVVITVDGDPVK